MGYIVRKISRAKWEQKEELGQNAIQADAVTTDLRTKGNCLSFWKCSTADEDELQEIVLALVAAPLVERIDKIDIAWIEEDYIKSKNIHSESTKGDTLISDLKDKHIDILRLDLQKICSLAMGLCKSIREDGNYKRYTKKEILELLCKAVEEKRLTLGVLSDKVVKELYPLLSK